jgi:predicted RNA-binding Zn ribbon-like protein
VSASRSGSADKPAAAARHVIDLANALRRNPARTGAELAVLLADAGLLPATAEAPGALSEPAADRLREAVARLAAVLRETDAERAATALNRILAEVAGPPRLTRHDGTDWHLHVDRAGDAEPDERLLASGAHALALLLSERGRAAWGVCGAHDCTAYYLDAGPGPGRRYCSATCSSRARVAAHRRRAGR